MKHSLHYTYDATGNKLKQLTLENRVTVNGNKNITTTNYINGFMSEISKLFYPMLRPTDL